MAANVEPNAEKAIAHKWEPIISLRGDTDYDFSEIDSLNLQWLAVKRGRGTAYDAFFERLTRSWAIETGIIEGLYTLNRGITENLVIRGISAHEIERGSTDKEPQELVRVLNDHLDAVKGVYDEIKERRPVSRSAIRQIHSILTRNQPTFTAVDQFGRQFETELNRGGFKTQPNNPTRNDGSLHEYCPPEHVDSELDNLLAWYKEYSQDTHSYHPLLTAAWLHHRFTQIHPFQDGNGRVVRALLTWHLVREDYLPVVVKRDDRDRYIAALECADGGDLVPFVELLVRLQRQTILEALGGSEFTEPVGAFEQVLGHIVEQVERQNVDFASHETEMRTVNSVAEALRDHAGGLMEQRAEQIVSSLERAGRTVLPHVLKGGPEDREHWYRRQVEETAHESGHRVNFSESRYFIRLTLTPNRGTRLPRLVLVVSLNHTGWQLTGIMAAASFALIEHYYDNSSEQSEEREPLPPINCTPEPFTFTWESNATSLLPRFTQWTEQSLAIALRQWGEHIA